MPSLQPGYSFVDAEIEVYRPKRVPFEVDAKFAGDDIRDVVKLLRDGWHTVEIISVWEAIVQRALDAGIARKRYRPPEHSGTHLIKPRKVRHRWGAVTLGRRDLLCWLELGEVRRLLQHRSSADALAAESGVLQR